MDGVAFEDLPRDMLKEIVERMELPDLIHVREVNMELRAVVNEVVNERLQGGSLIDGQSVAEWARTEGSDQEKLVVFDIAVAEKPLSPAAAEVASERAQRFGEQFEKLEFEAHRERVLDVMKGDSHAMMSLPEPLRDGLRETFGSWLLELLLAPEPGADLPLMVEGVHSDIAVDFLGAIGDGELVRNADGTITGAGVEDWVARLPDAYFGGYLQFR